MKIAKIVLLSLLAMSPAVSSAQDATGRIFGTIYDQQGAVVPDVHMMVTNTATQDTRNATTDKAGYFQLLALPIGTYKVSAEHIGFRTVMTTEQKLLINQALRIDIKLEVGSTNQTVDVGAEAAPVETVNATLGQSVTGRVLTNMPLNGRDMLDLALLQPGVTESNDDNLGAGNYSIAGGRSDSVTFLLDGGLNNDLLDNSNLIDPNPDAVAEFRILTSNYTAEYGRNGGGIISVVTKSGSNHVHGSASSTSSGTGYWTRMTTSIFPPTFRVWTSSATSTGRRSEDQSLRTSCFSFWRIRDNGRCRQFRSSTARFSQTRSWRAISLIPPVAERLTPG